MKKQYLSPYAESIKLKPMTVLMASTDGDLGDLSEISVISDSIESPDEMLFF